MTAVLVAKVTPSSLSGASTHQLSSGSCGKKRAVSSPRWEQKTMAVTEVSGWSGPYFVGTATTLAVAHLANDDSPRNTVKP